VSPSEESSEFLPAEPAPRPNKRRAWQLTLLGGARAGAFDPSALQPVFGAGAGWRSQPQSSAFTWRLRVEATMGTPVSANSALFRGDHRFVGGGASVGGAWSANSWFSIGLDTTVGIQATYLTGRVTGETQEASVVRLMPVLQVGAPVYFAAQPNHVYLRPSLGINPRRERYSVDGRAVLTTSGMWGALELGWNLDF
jgi:hypothetical protein